MPDLLDGVVVERPEHDLVGLDKAIQSECRVYERAGREVCAAMARIGQLLLDRKTHTPHGAFMRWVNNHFPLSHRTALRCIQAFRERVKLDTVSNLTERLEAQFAGTPPEERDDPSGDVAGNASATGTVVPTTGTANEPASTSDAATAGSDGIAGGVPGVAGAGGAADARSDDSRGGTAGATAPGASPAAGDTPPGKPGGGGKGASKTKRKRKGIEGPPTINDCNRICDGAVKHIEALHEWYLIYLGSIGYVNTPLTAGWSRTVGESLGRIQEEYAAIRKQTRQEAGTVGGAVPDAQDAVRAAGERFETILAAYTETEAGRRLTVLRESFEVVWGRILAETEPQEGKS